MMYGLLSIDTITQRQEVHNCATGHGLSIDKWLLTNEFRHRILKPDNIIYVYEWAALSTNRKQIIDIIKHCIQNNISVYSATSELYISNNIKSEHIDLMLDIQNNLVSSAARKGIKTRIANGSINGRIAGTKIPNRKLENKDSVIHDLLQSNISIPKIAKFLGVSAQTLRKRLKDSNNGKK